MNSNSFLASQRLFTEGHSIIFSLRMISISITLFLKILILICNSLRIKFLLQTSVRLLPFCCSLQSSFGALHPRMLALFTPLLSPCLLLSSKLNFRFIEDHYQRIQPHIFLSCTAQILLSNSHFHRGVNVRLYKFVSFRHYFWKIWI